MAACFRYDASDDDATKHQELSFHFARDVLAEVDGLIKRLHELRDRLPCVVLLGEANSGKTTIANTLLAGGVLPTSVITNTRHPILLRHATSISLSARTATGKSVTITNECDVINQSISLIEVGIPNERLKEFEILDTPPGFGLNAICELREVPAVRIPVWCTSATQAWKESERQTWLSYDPLLRQHGVLAVTRFDQILDAEQRERLMARLRNEAAPLFSKVISTSSLVKGKETFTSDISSLAIVIKERHYCSIIWLCERIINLTQSIRLPGARAHLDALMSAEAATDSQKGCGRRPAMQTDRPPVN